MGLFRNFNLSYDICVFLFRFASGYTSGSMTTVLWSSLERYSLQVRPVSSHAIGFTGLPLLRMIVLSSHSLMHTRHCFSCLMRILIILFFFVSVVSFVAALGFLIYGGR